ncbi:hypothetical protein E34_1921 [Lactococcus lactis subsp. lactis]|nr:hypothetical protein E34_1921 [Lactococcus lactis subsp. lactis]
MVAHLAPRLSLIANVIINFYLLAHYNKHKTKKPYGFSE